MGSWQQDIGVDIDGAPIQQVSQACVRHHLECTNGPDIIGRIIVCRCIV